MKGKVLMCANSPSSSSSVGARTHDYKVKVRVGLNRNDTVFENHSFAFLKHCERSEHTNKRNRPKIVKKWDFLSDFYILCMASAI